MTHEELLLFGERVRNARISAVLTQEDVSSKIGISLRFYQMIERGEKSLSLDTLRGLSYVLNTSIDYLLLWNISQTIESPISAMYGKLSPRQKEDLVKIMQLYLSACLDTPEVKMGKCMIDREMLDAMRHLLLPLQADIQDIKKRTETIENNVSGSRVILESDIDRKIDLLSEGHDMILSHLPRAEEVDALGDRVSTLETVVKVHSQDIKELKKSAVRSARRAVETPRPFFSCI